MYTLFESALCTNFDTVIGVLLSDACLIRCCVVLQTYMLTHAEKESIESSPYTRQMSRTIGNHIAEHKCHYTVMLQGLVGIVRSWAKFITIPQIRQRILERKHVPRLLCVPETIPLSSGSTCSDEFSLPVTSLHSSLSYLGKDKGLI